MIIRAIFEKMKILNFFLWELPLILRIDRKRKKRARDICKGTLDIEFERDWSVGLGATLGNEQKIKNYFSSLRIFPGKADSVIFYENRCSHFWENVNVNIFLVWTTLNFEDR